MDGNYHSWSTEFIKYSASRHWLTSDNTPSKVAAYGVLSGSNVESLQYQCFGERTDIVKYSDADRPTSGVGLINNICNYVTYHGTNDRLKCNMNLNITSEDKTLSITAVYRMTANGTGAGLKIALFGIIMQE